MKRKLRQRYRMLCPYSNDSLERLVRRDCIYIWSGSLLITFFVVLWNFYLKMQSGFYVIGCVSLAIFLLFHEVSGKRVEKVTESLYVNMIEYLAAVKHSFLAGDNVANAVIEAAENFGEEIRLHAALLYQILSGTERKEKVREYVVFTKYNRYLKLFLVQAYEASEKGDVMLNEEFSLFSENLEHLRLVVMEELYYWKKKQYEYAGYLLVSVVPVFAMPLLRKWGISFSEGLVSFYSSYGKIVELLTLFITYMVCCLICIAKEVYSVDGENQNELLLFPGLKQWYKKRLYQEEAEHEIRQFQSVILMERRMMDNTVLEMLEDMEIFSGLFRTVLRNCINTYAMGAEEALQKLKLEGGAIHPAFRELADGFLAVDDVGIRKAFAEVENNRNRLEKLKQLEAEVRLERRKDGIDLLSRIPILLTLGMYFILPFLVTSLRGVYEVFYILNEIQL